MTGVARNAAAADATSVAAIYNQGIEDRVATFETRPRDIAEIEGWISGIYPVIVVEGGGRVVAFSSASLYRPRDCYAGIWEFSVYVARNERARGYGGAALDALKTEARRGGAWKLVSRVFLENTPSRRMLARCGFREAGVYLKHGRLDGMWRDVVIVECLL